MQKADDVKIYRVKRSPVRGFWYVVALSLTRRGRFDVLSGHARRTKAKKVARQLNVACR
jgi:hypothetical protein